MKSKLNFREVEKRIVELDMELFALEVGLKEMKETCKHPPKKQELISHYGARPNSVEFAVETWRYRCSICGKSYSTTASIKQAGDYWKNEDIRREKKRIADNKAAEKAAKKAAKARG